LKFCNIKTTYMYMSTNCNRC